MRYSPAIIVGKIYKCFIAGRKAHFVVAMAMALLASTAQAQQRVVAFGDSLTAGFGLPQEQGFVPQLQAWLQGQGVDAVVINAGVSGDTTAGGKARVGWVLDEGADLVILELGANDMLRGVSPAEARRNLDAILAEITARGIKVLVAGMLAPPNYGEDYRVEFDAIYPELAAKYGADLYPFFLQGLGQAEGVAELFSLMQSDGMHPNAKGVQLIVEDIGPVVLDALQ
ncbi:MAG: arylesterase [Rhodobacteraceae bacterium]|nr:arylesterase [Paracoccaceae bacterium]